MLDSILVVILGAFISTITGIAASLTKKALDNIENFRKEFDMFRDTSTNRHLEISKELDQLKDDVNRSRIDKQARTKIKILENNLEDMGVEIKKKTDKIEENYGRIIHLEEKSGLTQELVDLVRAYKNAKEGKK